MTRGPKNILKYDLLLLITQYVGPCHRNVIIYLVLNCLDNFPGKSTHLKIYGIPLADL